MRENQVIYATALLGALLLFGASAKAYFRDRSGQLDSPDLPGSWRNMKNSTLRKLKETERLLGRPLQYNRGFSTPEHNVTIPGYSDTSSHLDGYAVDIHAPKETQTQLI